MSSRVAVVYPRPPPGRHRHRVRPLPDLEVFARLLDAAAGTLRTITIAPELPEAPTLLDAALAEGITVAVGHTDATYDEATAAFRRGARVATHLFNGMSPVRHREPGAPLAAVDAGAACEVSTTGPSPPCSRAASGRGRLKTPGAGHRCNGGRGTPRRPLRAGRRVRDGEVRRPDTVSLAGSTLTMDVAVRRGVQEVGLPLPVVVAAATANPAAVLGTSEGGSLVPGHSADVVHLDDDLRVVRVMRHGVWVPRPSFSPG